MCIPFEISPVSFYRLCNSENSKKQLPLLPAAAFFLIMKLFNFFIFPAADKTKLRLEDFASV